MKVNYTFFVLIFLTVAYWHDNNALKILFFDHTFPALTQTFVLNQITYMIDKGHDVTILSRGRYDFAMYNPTAPHHQPALHPDIEKYKLMNRVHYSTLPADKRDFDIILCEFGNLGKFFINLRKTYNIKGKFITFFRGRDLNALPAGDKNFYRELLNTGDYFLTVSLYFKAKLIRLGCKPHKVGVLHSTIDCPKFSFRPRKLSKGEKLCIVTTGRFVEKKGIEYAIKAVTRFARKHSNIEYNIIGGGPLYKKFKHLIRQLNMEDKIHLLGWCSHEEVKKVLDRAHIFLLPSVTGKDRDREGIPNAIMEAMAMGPIVVSTFHSGIPEIVRHRRTGLLAPERDVGALTEKLEYLMSHQDLWEKMGVLARKCVENHFDKDTINERLNTLCEQLAAEK